MLMRILGAAGGCFSQWNCCCQSCDRKTIDRGRCQAFLLTRNAEATDPVCHLSPDPAQLQSVFDQSSEAFVYRSVV